MNYKTVEDIANELGITKRVIYYAIATNKIKARKIADVYWIEPKEMKKLRPDINNSKCSPTDK